MWFSYFKNKAKLKKNSSQRWKNFKCNSCVKSFTQAGNLRVHIKTVHEGHTSDYKCDSCDKGHKDHKCDSCENHSLKVVI